MDGWSKRMGYFFSVNNEICLDFFPFSKQHTTARLFSYSPACPRARSRAAAGRPPPRPLPLPPYARCRGLSVFSPARRRRSLSRYWARMAHAVAALSEPARRPCAGLLAAAVAGARQHLGSRWPRGSAAACRLHARRSQAAKQGALCCLIG